jgi:hypothetical protein
MTIILAVGAPGAGHDAVFALLAQAGVAPAAAAGSQSAALVGQLLLQASEVDTNAQAPAIQVSPAPPAVQHAIALLAANEGEQTWGWADHQTTWLLDFWRKLAPRARILLVYESAADHVARHLGKDSDGPEQVELLLQEWQAWNSSLLRYHLRNKATTLLVDASAVQADPTALFQLIAGAWGVQGLGDPYVPPPAASRSILLSFAADALVPQRHAARVLQEQLDNATSLPTGSSQHDTRWSVWTGTCDTLALLDRQSSAAARAQDLLVVAQRAREEALETAEAVRREMDRAKKVGAAEVMSAERRLAEAEARWEEEKRRLNEAQVQSQLQLESAKADQDLISLQLHQVQEELERCFAKYQKLEKGHTGFVAEFWRTHQPQTLSVDLRRRLFGDQWHEAEIDGRWTGPGALSTIEIAPLAPGRYLLELDIVDAMEREAIAEVSVELDGRSYPVSTEYVGNDHAFPAICSAVVEITDPAPDAPLQVGLRLPRTRSPAEQGSADERQLGLRVQQLRLIRQGGQLPVEP